MPLTPWRIRGCTAIWLLFTFFLLLPGIRHAQSATNVFAVSNSGASAYVFNGVSNPDLSLVRGFTYTFNVSASGHPFWIKSSQGTGTGNAYNDGVTGNGTQNGAVEFIVPTNAPSLLFYNCQFHSSMTGRINVEDPPVVQIVDVERASLMTFTSTGTDALMLSVDSRTNLLSGDWTQANIVTNVYGSGTNTTTVILPTSSQTYFRVKQGF